MGTDLARTSREQLARLIYDGLMGRSVEALFKQLTRRFLAAGETLSWATFLEWLGGQRFPANKHRQDMLAEVVGGPCGDAIRRLPSPAFRGWRRRVMRETEEHMTIRHGKAVRSGSDHRLFPHIPVKGEDGRTYQRPVITCIECGTREVVIRNGASEAAELFEKKGWEVGKNEKHDYCPMCVRARNTKNRVIKMEDHLKKNETPSPAALEPGMSKEEGRILSRLIDDHWAGDRYAPGWSDAKMAEHAGKPEGWVKAIRERDFGGTGEDPAMVDFVERQVAISMEMEALKTMMGELEGSISSLGSSYEHAQRTLAKYREAHNALQGKAKALSEVADKMRPFKAA